MSMYGANPEQLARLGSTLKHQIDTINTWSARSPQRLAAPHGWVRPAINSRATGTQHFARHSIVSGRHSMPPGKIACCVPKTFSG